MSRDIYLCDVHDRRILHIRHPRGGTHMEPPCDKLDLSTIPAVGPVPRPWREGTLTRATELHALSKWVLANPCPPGSPPDSVRENPQALVEAIEIHLGAARAAAKGMKPLA